MVADHLRQRRATQNPQLNTLTGRGQMTHNRAGILSSVFNPSAAFFLNIMGYVSLAPLSNMFLSESSLGGILINLLIVGFTALAFLFHRKNIKSVKCKHVFFGALFLAIYGLRLCTETFIDGTQYPTGNFVVLLYFSINIGLLVPLVTLMSWQLNDKQTYTVILMLCVIFLGGMFLNLSVLQETASHRLSLDKVNPISMAHLSLSLIVSLLVFCGNSNKSKLIAIILCLFLFFIIVYARARSAYLAPIIMGLFYLVAQRGQRRIFMLISAVFFVPIGFSLISPDIKDVVFNRLLFLFSGEDESAQVRLILINGSWELFTDNMIIGKTILDPIKNFYPHNIILESLISTGLIGAGLLLTHISVSLWAGFKILRAASYPKFVELAVLLFIQSLFTAVISGAIWGASVFVALSFFIIYVYYGRVKISRGDNAA